MFNERKERTIMRDIIEEKINKVFRDYERGFIWGFIFCLMIVVAFISIIIGW